MKLKPNYIESHNSPYCCAEIEITERLDDVIGTVKYNDGSIHNLSLKDVVEAFALSCTGRLINSSEEKACIVNHRQLPAFTITEQ